LDVIGFRHPARRFPPARRQTRFIGKVKRQCRLLGQVLPPWQPV
jgi:hypothetical protein